MRKHILVTATMAMILVLSTLRALPAQEAFVVYLEGVVEYHDGTRWVDSFIGDSFPVGTEVRIGNGGFLEVVAGDRTIRYTESGTYRIRAAEASRNQETGSTDLGGLIRGTVSRFARTAAISATRRNSVAAGVRGSEAAQEPSVEWAGDDSPMELVSAGIEALNDGEIEEASFHRR